MQHVASSYAAACWGIRFLYFLSCGQTILWIYMPSNICKGVHPNSNLLENK